jgi:hypothetical protein
MLVIILLVLYLLFLWVGWYVGSRNGRGGLGLLLAFLLGPIGVLIAAVVRPSTEFEAARQHELSRQLRHGPTGTPLGAALQHASLQQRSAAAASNPLLREVRAEASNGGSVDAVDAFAATHDVTRPLSGWAVCDGPYRFLAVADGVFYVAHPAGASRVESSARLKAERQSDGSIVRLDIGSVTVRDLRPIGPAASLLSRLGSRVSIVDVESAPVVAESSNLTSPTAISTDLATRLQTLDDLLRQGLIGADEHAGRRQAIVDSI